VTDVFSCYEAFIRIVDSMFDQHAKWLKVTSRLPWRRKLASLNYRVMAIDAVDVLRRKGCRAHRLEFGIPERRARRWRVGASAGRHAGSRP